MFGNDVERILAGVNKVKDITANSINILTDTIAYRITSDATHGGISTSPCYPEESEVSSSAHSFVSPIRSAMNSIVSDFQKMNELANGLYVDINSFNNGYGSPWTELNKLEESIKLAESFSHSHSNLNWIGEKAGLLGLLNSILSASIDSKWALIYYHDYIQRGYDNKYNDNDPSIKFNTGIDTQSIGNVKHDYSENVHIKEPSIDPF